MSDFTTVAFCPLCQTRFPADVPTCFRCAMPLGPPAGPAGPGHYWASFLSKPVRQRWSSRPRNVPADWFADLHEDPDTLIGLFGPPPDESHDFYAPPQAELVRRLGLAGWELLRELPVRWQGEEIRQLDFRRAPGGLPGPGRVDAARIAPPEAPYASECTPLRTPLGLEGTIELSGPGPDDGPVCRLRIDYAARAAGLWPVWTLLLCKAEPGGLRPVHQARTSTRRPIVLETLRPGRAILERLESVGLPERGRRRLEWRIDLAALAARYGHGRYESWLFSGSAPEQPGLTLARHRLEA